MSRFLPILLALSVVLMGGRCADATAVPEDVWRQDVAPPFDYALYSDAQGRLVGETSGVLLVHRSEHLERVYSDASAGDARARVVVRQLETVAEAAGVDLADKALGLGCTSMPTCTVRWAELGELIPSPGPGGTRLRSLLADGFARQARREHLENAVITAALNVLLAGGVAMAVEGKAGLAERSALAKTEGALAVEEAAALEARLRDAEAVAEGARQSSNLEVLARLRPAAQRPPPGVVTDNPRWLDYVRYWEQRYEEMSGARQQLQRASTPKPPLEWSSYTSFQGRLRQAVEFQHDVTRTLQQDAVLPVESRSWLHEMKRPRVDENVGLLRESGPPPTYVDQLVVDEATLGAGTRPVVHSFSNKQRDFQGMTAMDVKDRIRADVQEALSKYGGVVEVRRPGHPLFGQRVTISKVHLVYGKSSAARIDSRTLRDISRHSNVEIQFHPR